MEEHHAMGEHHVMELGHGSTIDNIFHEIPYLRHYYGWNNSKCNYYWLHGNVYALAGAISLRMKRAPDGEIMAHLTQLVGALQDEETAITISKMASMI
jgi:hypothetical protein